MGNGSDAVEPRRLLRLRWKWQHQLRSGFGIAVCRQNDRREVAAALRSDLPASAFRASAIVINCSIRGDNSSASFAPSCISAAFLFGVGFLQSVWLRASAASFSCSLLPLNVGNERGGVDGRLLAGSGTHKPPSLPR